MSYLEGKRIKLTAPENMEGTVTGRVLAVGLEDNFDALIQLDSDEDAGRVIHAVFHQGSMLEFLDDTPPINPGHELPGQDQAHVSIVISYDTAGERETIRAFEIVDPHVGGREALKDRALDMSVKLAVHVVDAIRGNSTPPKVDDTPEPGELDSAYETLQGLLEGQALGLLVPAALNRLYDAIRAARPHKATSSDVVKPPDSKDDREPVTK